MATEKESRSKIGKLKFLHLLEIIKNTDELHPISTPEIIAVMAEKGFTAERKSIYSDIQTLIDYGYDIIQTRTPKQGWFLASREFEMHEIRLLADAVASAGFITRKKSNELIQKLSCLIGQHEWEQINRQLCLDNRHKNQNEEIFYNIDKIQRAISGRRRINIKYFRRGIDDRGKICINTKTFERISPYALVWESDHYYLVCNTPKYNNLMHMRLDRIKSVSLLDEAIRPVSEVSRYLYEIDTADYINKTFNMFGGEPASITVKCPNSFIEEVCDRFSDDITIFNCDKDSFCFSTVALISDGLISFLLQFEGIEVLRPDSLREKLKERIEKLNEVYRK